MGLPRETRVITGVTAPCRPASGRLLELPDTPVVIRGDEQRLRQVLANLLSNAGRHTPAGTVVTVALRAVPPAPAQRAHRAAVITVTDNGPGIPPELQPDVFERFVRGDTSRSRAAGSSGLGLAIVHAVRRGHGGTASVTSQPGETRFVIELPISD